MVGRQPCGLLHRSARTGSNEGNAALLPRAFAPTRARLELASPSPSSGWTEHFHLQAVVRHTTKGPGACARSQETRPDDTDYFSELLIEVNFSFSVVPRPFTAAIIASEIPAAINPYSIAVAPHSSRQKLLTNAFIDSSFSVFRRSAISLRSRFGTCRLKLKDPLKKELASFADIQQQFSLNFSRRSAGTIKTVCPAAALRANAEGLACEGPIAPKSDGLG